jgi:Cof subfamily protein (haloacid dehalogenase superfamily)
MKYKALMLDVDGTVVPYGSYMEAIMPSQTIVDSIRLAQKKVTVCLASGRSYYRMQEILKYLQLRGIVIANDGAVVIDSRTDTLLFEQVIPPMDIQSICSFLEKKKLAFLFGNHDANTEFSGKLPKKVLNIYTREILTNAAAEKLIRDLSHFPKLSIRKYRHGIHEKYGIVVSHVNATKQYGIFEAAKILKIETHEIIGVGDSYNDFPLLMACGLKVAMGNAVPELKAIADYVAPSVDDDGVADVIEKFILTK